MGGLGAGPKGLPASGAREDRVLDSILCPTQLLQPSWPGVPDGRGRRRVSDVISDSVMQCSDRTVHPGFLAHRCTAPRGLFARDRD
eukprot:234290-Hanusia_phi.AAC.1